MTPELKKAWANHTGATAPDDCETCRILLAYLDAEARARRAEWNGCMEWNHNGCKCTWTDADWRASVLKELED